MFHMIIIENVLFFLKEKEEKVSERQFTCWLLIFGEIPGSNLFASSASTLSKTLSMAVPVPVPSALQYN